MTTLNARGIVASLTLLACISCAPQPSPTLTPEALSACMAKMAQEAPDAAETGLRNACLSNYAGAQMDEQRQAEDQVASPPVSEDPVGRQQACDDVRSAIADQQSRSAIASSGALPPLLALSAQRQFSSRIAALENRASALQCTAAFSQPAAPAEPQAASSKIAQCVAACTANTSRTKEQCFDACNH